jgi:hypothetical protein
MRRNASEGIAWNHIDVVPLRSLRLSHSSLAPTRSITLCLDGRSLGKNSDSLRSLVRLVYLLARTSLRWQWRFVGVGLAPHEISLSKSGQQT